MSSTSAPPRPARADHLNLAPPRQGHWTVPLGLALVVHGLLVVALTWGVAWKQNAEPAVFEAELWSRLPVPAAPAAAEPPAVPAPPQPQPVETPKPSPAPPQPKPQTEPSEAKIATEQAKKKQAEAEERREREKEDALKKKAAADKLAADKLATEKRALAHKKAADEKRERERKQADEKRLDQLREDQMRRMMGQAGASGAPTATGTAQQSSGPSPGYGGRVVARIRPNVVFTENLAGNPRAEVEVRTLPDGTIASRRIVKSSGNAAWDEAVLKAIDRTGTLPRDTDGRVPPLLIIGLRPQD